MNPELADKYYFIGIGGIGMSALALYFHQKNKLIKGYDRTETNVTETLQAQNIEITFDDSVNCIPAEVLKPDEKTIIVYTPAIPSDHAQLVYFRKNNFTILKRSELLGLITRNNFTIAVAGTHGKTSTSWMIVHYLRTAGVDCYALLGGISVNYNTNYLQAGNADCKVFVVEADEYDKSFLQLTPDIAIVTSVEPDHLDIYGNENEVVYAYQQFIDKTKTNGTVILPWHAKLTIPSVVKNHFVFGKRIDNNPFLKEVKVENSSFVYDFSLNGKTIENVVAGVPGIHNAWNAMAAATATDCVKSLDNSTIRKAISTYKGVKRRFETIVDTESIVYIDDYAHHPTEIEATISTARMLYPEMMLTVIFQPHLFTRTRDFAEEFAKSLCDADYIILLEIYPAREVPIEGINSQMLLEMIDSKYKMLVSAEYLLEWLENFEDGVLLTMGAGDIDKLVEPIGKILSGDR